MPSQSIRLVAEIEAISAFDFDFGGDAVDGPLHPAGHLESRHGVGDFLQRALHRGLGHLVQAEHGRQQFPECGQLSPTATGFSGSKRSSNRLLA